MNAGAFSYLLDSPPAKRVDPDLLHQMAKTAARDLVMSGVNLNASIKKLAAANDLNQEQVARVCEMANLATHQALWGSSASKEKVAFEVADPKKVDSASKAKPERASAAHGGFGADYACPPSDLASGSGSLAGMLGVDPSSVHNGLTNEPERKQIVIILQKKAAERRRAHDVAVVAHLEAETAEKLAFQQIKQAVFNENTTFSEVFRACKAAGLGKVAAEYLPRFQAKLLGEVHGKLKTRLEKTAIASVTKDLISDDLEGVTVSNGAHPVLISMDTLQTKNEAARNGLHSVLRIDDDVKIKEQRLRELGGKKR